MGREHELKYDNVRYIDGEIKVFMIAIVDQLHTKVLSAVDGYFYKVENTYLSAFPSR